MNFDHYWLTYFYMHKTSLIAWKLPVSATHMDTESLTSQNLPYLKQPIRKSLESPTSVGKIWQHTGWINDKSLSVTAVATQTLLYSFIQIL